MTGQTQTTRLFVDAISDDVARMLWGEETVSLPLAFLPAGTREGDWVEISVGVVPAPDTDTEARRQRLVADDPGGTIKL